eukprot:gb/GECH01014697.1/.p1 GENE.gb/GECH01014697.1/~~gb/GECH01014697.1/.p1  ORF type:complete len:304 (+),score=49.71 gb/GECH01014697.1/:1-912(+)
MTNETPPLPLHFHFICGAAAGLVSDLFVHPIETIRTQLQVQRGTKKPSSATKTFKRIISTEGTIGLYRGFGIVPLLTVPGYAVYFSGYEYLKRTLGKHIGIQEGSVAAAVTHLSCGFIADGLGALIWVPMDVIKQRMMVQPSGMGAKYSGPFQAIRRISAEEGIRGLYSGFGMAMATYGPFVAIYFMTYEDMKFRLRRLWKTDTDDGLPSWLFLASAGASGAFSAAITCPMDVIKTRLMVQGPHREYRSGMHGLSLILRQESIKTLFRGLKPRMLWMAGGTATSMAAFEYFKRIARQYFFKYE